MSETKNQFTHELSRHPMFWGSAFSSFECPWLKKLQSKDHFLLLAWAAACPVAEETWTFYEEAKTTDWILNRYETTNFVTKHIVWDQAKALNPSLYQALMERVERSPDEPVGKKELHNVPVWHLTEMSPLSTDPGYALSRIFIEVAKIEKYQDTVEDLSKAEPAIALLQQCIKAANSPDQLLAIFSERAFRLGVNPAVILDHDFAGGKFDEENHQSARHKLWKIFETFAPNLKRAHDFISVGHAIGFPPKDPVQVFLKQVTYDPNYPGSSLRYFETPQRVKEFVFQD